MNKPKSENTYYEVKCPVCDFKITSKINNILKYKYIECPSCKKKIQLYSLIGYNMWLAEQGKAEKTDKSPVDNQDIEETTTTDTFIKNIQTILNGGLDDIEEDEDEETGINFELVDHVAFNRAAICNIHFTNLMKNGFSKKESIDLLKQLMDSGYLF